MLYRKSAKPAEPWFDWNKFIETLTQAVYKGSMAGFIIGIVVTILLVIDVNDGYLTFMTWVAGLMGVFTLLYGPVHFLIATSDEGFDAEDFPYRWRPSRILAYPILVTGYWFGFSYLLHWDHLNAHETEFYTVMLVGMGFTFLALMAICWALKNKRFMFQRKKKE